MSDFAPAGSLFLTNYTKLQQIVSEAIGMFMPKLDPVWEGVIKSSQGVGKVNEIGRDLRIIKPYSGGYTGVIEEAYGNQSYQNEAALFGGQTQAYGSKLFTQQMQQMFPDALEGANQSTYWLAVPMRARVTNLAVSLGESQLEANPNIIGQVIGPKIKGFAKHVAHYVCNSWWSDPTKGGPLGCFVGASTITVAEAGKAYWTGNTTVTRAISGYLADPASYAGAQNNIERLAVGMRVDIYEDVATTTFASGPANTNALRINAIFDTPFARIKAFVSAVDELTNGFTIQLDSTVSFAGTNGNGRSNGGLTAGRCYWILPANVTSAGTGYKLPANIHSWAKFGDSNGSSYNAANTLLGADADQNQSINVNVHPEFKSFLKSSVGTLTEHKMRQYLHRFHVAKGRYGMEIDTLVASDGVWINYEAQKIGQYQIDRTSKTSGVENEGSRGGFKFTCDGKTYEGLTSQFVEAGTVWGIKTGGNNWKKYVPPGPKGATKDGLEAGLPFEFVLPALTGGSTAKWPITITASGTNPVSTHLTEFSQMPGLLRMQIVPDQPACMKLTGVDYDQTFMS